MAACAVCTAQQNHPMKNQAEILLDDTVKLSAVDTGMRRIVEPQRPLAWRVLPYYGSVAIADVPLIDDSDPNRILPKIDRGMTGAATATPRTHAWPSFCATATWSS